MSRVQVSSRIIIGTVVAKRSLNARVYSQYDKSQRPPARDVMPHDITRAAARA
jgi:hypothetical protein